MKNKKIEALLLLLLTIFLNAAAYDYTDNQPASVNPPGGLESSEVPMFVSVAWDDNQMVGGVTWITDFLASKTNPSGVGNKKTYDGSPLHHTFLVNTAGLADNKELRVAYKKLLDNGHEIANHTRSHSDGLYSDSTEWYKNLNDCIEDLKKKYPDEGIGLSHMWGFRAPYMNFNDNLYPAMKALGLMYDCSGVGGNAEGDKFDGTGYYWPYTLDNGLPGKSAIGKHPGMWRLPKNGLIDTNGLKHASTDYSLLSNSSTSPKWNKEQFLSAMKHTLDLKYNSNRSPFIFGGHTEMYTIGSTFGSMPNITPEETQDVMEAFIEYALTLPDVRIVSSKEILDWVRNPVALNDTSKNNEAMVDNNQISEMDTIEGAIVIPGNLGANLLESTAWGINHDSYGSSVDTGTSLFVNNTVKAKFTMVASDEAKKKWAWGSLSHYLEAGGIVGLDSILVIYSSTERFKLTLTQENLADSGTSYSAGLDNTNGQLDTAVLPISRFKQPSWLSPEKATPLDLSKVMDIAFSPDVNDLAGIGEITLYEVRLNNVNGTEIEELSLKKSLSNFTARIEGGNIMNFFLPDAGRYEISIYSLNGKRIKNFKEREFKSGSHNLYLGSSAAAKGFIIVRFIGERGVYQEKIMMFK